MRRLIFVTAFLAGFVIRFEPCFGEDPLAATKVSVLKGLRSVALLVRASTPNEMANAGEWSDMATVGLARNAPAIKISDSNSANVDWLVVEVRTTDRGAVLTLYLHRWVRVRDSGEEVFAPVWSDYTALFGGVSKSDLKGALDTLLTSFAADYLRANH